MKRLISALIFVSLLAAFVIPVCVFAEESAAPTTDEPFVNKIFQGLFVGVMTIGLIGLPAYFWLNARRNRLLREYKETNDNNDAEDEEPENSKE